MLNIPETNFSKMLLEYFIRISIFKGYKGLEKQGLKKMCYQYYFLPLQYRSSIQFDAAHTASIVTNPTKVKQIRLSVQFLLTER